MSKLSARETEGCKKLLRLLPDADILALSDTVTNRMITVESTKEAIEAIVTYSRDAEELLKRRKMHREVLFRYLAEEGVTMLPNSEKPQLIRRTLALWSCVKVTDIQKSESQVSSPANIGDGLSDLTELGKQFCQWFFHLINSQNPAMGQPKQDWGPHHFWEDARLRLLSSTVEQQMEEFNTAQMVSMRLLSLSGQERLLFCPNLEPQGLKCMSSPHGVVLVAVAGTIHRDDICLGVFEQAFGLIRCPQETSKWKIKFVDLEIRGQNVLRDGQQGTPPQLTYDSAQLLRLCS